MDKTVQAAAVQFNISLGDVDANLAKVEGALHRVKARAAQLAVLPEMWSAGYDYKRLARHAEETPRVVEAIVRRSAELELVVVGSLPELDNGKIFNTAYVIDRGVLVGSYRKLHMSSPMVENMCSFR